ncbi:hypothetical protein [Piscinibacter sp.]|uniref:hypothetical protein n=1 Tax=Piscinibacter sp. TaxID=1903157 RepID=UPI0039E39D88
MKTLAQVFAVPLLLGVLATVGLVGALVGDGVWDVLSWLTLGSTIVVALWYALRRGPRARRAAG